jgi:alcohol dehydrogenase, propanol-preferring
LTDAGLTPYRTIKKVKHSLDPGTSIAVVGIGGLGSYAIQYAKLLAPNSNTKTLNSKKTQDIRSEVNKITEGKGVRTVIDCVGDLVLV